MPTLNELLRDVLVVTPTLGESPWLDETVASVENCIPGCQHVLVAPRVQVERLAALYPHLRVTPEIKPGLYAAINQGIATAKPWGLFTYINDDDILLRPFRAVLEQYITRQGPAIVYGKVLLLDGKSRPIGEIPVSRLPRFNRALYAERLEPVFQHGTVFNRPAMNLLGGFDESFRFCGDSEMLARACKERISFDYIGGSPVAGFRLHGGQLTKNRSAMLAERARVDEKLQLLKFDQRGRKIVAKVLYRIFNLGVYTDRIWRFGWRTFDQILATAK